MENEKRSRGRPPILTPEEKEQRRIEYDKRRNERHKETGYAAQKRYKNKVHEIKVIIRQEFKATIDELVAKTGKNSPAELFLDAVAEKYNVTLTPEVDKKDEKL